MGDRRVLIVMYPHVQPLDVAGPHEVFAGANEALDALGRSGPRYELVTVSEHGGLVRGESGLGLHADLAINDVGPAWHPIQTLLIPGGNGAPEVSSGLIDWLRRMGTLAERVVTVCSGTFPAAAAGLCEGKRVTTHWSRAGQLAAIYPELRIDPDPIYIQDGNLWTSAGVTSGIDLALALVEKDCGVEVARLVARHLVVYLHRPGGQSQFAMPVWSRPAEGRPVREACDIIHTELSSDLSAAALADRVGLSTRHFTRRFRTEVGETVARHVERQRVEAARQILEIEAVGLDVVAHRCGFGTAETMRRAFHRRLELSPDAYRRQFRSS